MKKENIKCSKCRTTDFKKCYSIECPMRVEDKSTNSESLKISEIIEAFCQENKLSNNIKNGIIKLCKDSYIKGSNDCHNIWVQTK